MTKLISLYEQYSQTIGARNDKLMMCLKLVTDDRGQFTADEKANAFSEIKVQLGAEKKFIDSVDNSRMRNFDTNAAKAVLGEIEKELETIK